MSTGAPDVEALFRYVRELVDIPSVTGDEAAVAARVVDDLGEMGLNPRLQEVAPGRANVVASAGPEEDARVFFCTHLDTVPPFFGSSETETHVAGRGSCDAKGILAAMVFAARDLLEAGASGFGFLFTVGEEVDSAGAIRANEIGPPGGGDGRDRRARFLVCGEPTEGVMASGHKGTFRAVVRAAGTPAHSAYPEAGDSAIHRLLGFLARVRATEWGRSDVLGRATVNVGLISGGVAGNVFAPSAEATVYLRLVGEAGPARARFAAMVAEDDRLEIEVIGQNDAVFCERLSGFETGPMSYSTDIPFLPRWGAPLLVGPGSIHDAHTAGERVSKSQLVDAVRYYREIAGRLLS